MSLWIVGGTPTHPDTTWTGYKPIGTDQIVWTQTLWNFQRNPSKSTHNVIKKWEGTGFTRAANKEEVRQSSQQSDLCLQRKGIR